MTKCGKTKLLDAYTEVSETQNIVRAPITYTLKCFFLIDLHSM